MSRAALARALCRAGAALSQRGLIAGLEGNLSARLGRDRFLVTPKGAPKGELKPADLVEVTLDGRRKAGRREPSSELALHLALYGVRPDIQAIVHAHPPVATGFATAGRSLDGDVVPELIAVVGPVVLVPYGTPGTGVVGEQAARVVGDSDALLLASHGAVTLGRTVEEAVRRMESLEQGARILLTAHQLGGPVRLPRAEVARLAAMRDRSRGRTA